MLLLDLSHTSHSRAQTGIQRVCRALQRELDASATPITWDPYARQWRELNDGERRTLNASVPARKRRSVWPLSSKLSGWRSRLLGPPHVLPTATGLIVPELFSPDTARAIPFLKVSGPRVALFHDAIALKLPELTPARTVARFPAYLQELLTFDGIAAVSEDSAECLRDYWRWLGLTATPTITTIPLGVARREPAGDMSNPGQTRLRILCVGTIEGRKNHLALLEACEALWRDQCEFELQLIGLGRADTAAPALAKIEALKRSGRPLIYAGSATDDELEAAYAVCHFTIYPSLCEGFGLPVIESLQHGKPCICSGRGALGESASGGGCMMLDSVDSAALTAALRKLVTTPAEITTLAHAARQRTFRTWGDYVRDLTDWMGTL